MYKSEEQWEQNGIDYKEWHNVPEKDIAYYDYADYTEERYPLSPEASPTEGTPRGRVTEYNWESSQVYPGVKGKYWLYVPEQYKGQDVCLMVFLDGEWYIQDKVPEVLDSMIAKEEIPVMIGLFISPGDKGPGLPRYGGTDNRSMEYDSIDGRYAEFLEKEIISKIKKDYKISDDAWKHGICGISSSGNAAFAAAWNRNDLFTRVLTHIGSFTNIRGGHNFPSMVRKGKRRNLRVFLQTGEHDLNTCFGDWKIANMDMESALKYREYPVHLVIGPGGHSGRYGMSILPESLRWLWKKEDKSGKE